jgi:hypothetical protein
MCPVCIANAAAMAAGAGSTGGVLAICITKFRNKLGKYFQRNFDLFQKAKEKSVWQPGSRATSRTSRLISQ